MFFVSRVSRRKNEVLGSPFKLSDQSDFVGELWACVVGALSSEHGRETNLGKRGKVSTRFLAYRILPTTFAITPSDWKRRLRN